MSARPHVAILAAVGRDRTIGKDGAMPWHFPEDLRAFKAQTTGTALVMGRRTFESIGRPLPGRDNIVVTHTPDAVAARHAGVFAAASLAAAIDLAASRGATRVSVIGGGEIYEAALGVADEMILTYVPHDGGGDTFFPVWHETDWEETRRRVVGRCVTVWYSRVRAAPRQTPRA